MNRPIIGITSEILNIGMEFFPSFRMLSLNEDYKKLVADRGGVPIVIPITDDFELLDYYIDMCDGFVFTGGGDINPIFYNESPNHALGVLDNERDKFEIELMEKVLENNKPMFGICRGMQILNIVLGGNLIQHIPDEKNTFNHMSQGNKYDVSHIVKFKEDNLFNDLFGDSLYVNSTHHQSIGRLGEKIEVLGEAEDGIIEAIGVNGYDFVYGVQWHPEGLVYKDDSMNKLTDRFLEACKD